MVEHRGSTIEQLNDEPLSIVIGGKLEQRDLKTHRRFAEQVRLSPSLAAAGGALSAR